MANHSIIELRKKTSPRGVEGHFKTVNRRRFRDRLLICPFAAPPWTQKPDGCWTVVAPGTKPEPSKIDPEPEDLGFILWLHKGGLAIEIRHVIYNSWLRWVQDVFKHELAKLCEVTQFDTGDGVQPTNPEQYKETCRAFYMRNFKTPLSESDRAFLQERVFDDIPPGWE